MSRKILENDAHIGPLHNAKETEKGYGKTSKSPPQIWTFCNKHNTPIKKKDKQSLVTWTSGAGETRKKIDYIIISNNVKNWPIYSKVKWTANTDSINQHNIVFVGIRLKFKKQPTHVQLKHSNFVINHLRDNTAASHTDWPTKYGKQPLTSTNEKPDRKRKRSASWK